MTVGQLGAIAGNSWTGIQASNLRIPPVNGIHKIVKNSQGQISGKLQRQLQLLLLRVKQI